MGVNSLQRDLAAKMELEVAMLGAPSDESLRDAYFDTLARFSAGRTGLSHAVLPELGHPLYFRCGTADTANLAHVFRHDAYGGPMRSSPLQVLDLGAYAGYAAVYLARRFPQAQILCVEPSESNAGLLLLNTAPYRRIARLAAAAWPRACWLEVASRRRGDWGTGLRERPPGCQGTIRGLPVADLLLHVGWTHVDMVRCDIAGAEALLFAEGAAPWLHTLDALMIRIHDDAAPGADQIVAACFDPAHFAWSQNGRTRLFERHDPYRADLHHVPRAIALLHAEPGLFPFVLQNLPDAQDFLIFDNHSCQILAAQAAQAAPAQVMFPRTLNGHTWFSSGIEGDFPLTFTVELRDEDDALVATAQRSTGPGDNLHLSLAFPAVTGRHWIVLRVTREADADAAVHGSWINPRMS